MGATHPRTAVDGYTQRCTLDPLFAGVMRTWAHAPARLGLICKQGVVGSIPIVSTTSLSERPRTVSPTVVSK